MRCQYKKEGRKKENERIPMTIRVIWKVNDRRAFSSPLTQRQGESQSRPIGPTAARENGLARLLSENEGNGGATNSEAESLQRRRRVSSVFSVRENEGNHTQ
jgi:hypothetical protein